MASQFSDSGYVLVRPYAIKIIEADKVEDAFQYHGVRSFSL